MPVPVVPCKAIEIGEARRAVVIVEALTRENYAYFTDLECTKETMQPAPAGKAHLGRVAEGAASEAASSARSINSMRCERISHRGLDESQATMQYAWKGNVDGIRLTRMRARHLSKSSVSVIETDVGLHAIVCISS